ncbi:hypothetical protein [Stenoxybacter acetivorans]|uniref:hypothetical protein n=1 Tax=Stenoxybacter acetivorans TaxID=422441 RepID=UPI00068E8966|nr:hypothetical protein [Stenoxybacter acetivorans]
MSFSNATTGKLKDALCLCNDAKQINNYVKNGGTNLDGLNTLVAALSLAATAASIRASVVNSKGVTSEGMFLVAHAYEFNGAVASASSTLAYANIKEGNYADAASNILAGASAVAGMVETAQASKPGVNPAEAIAGTVATIASLASMAIAERENIKDSGDYWKDKLNDLADKLKEAYEEALNDFRDWFLPKVFDLGDLFRDWTGQNRDGKYHIYDPIVLDLDGDGIETVGHDKHVGALFDHNNDGIRTATGWVSADDGILVVDKNQDGIISNGNEIFGDSYRKANGETAVNGYDALAEFDSNQDGKITAEDARFTELKIWRDLNQDGFGSANELFSLIDLGVAVLNLDYKNTNTQLKGNNTLAQTGSYETADGETRLMGDVNFSFNALYSRYAEHIELTEQQQQTANLQGMGRVRDMCFRINKTA